MCVFDPSLRDDGGIKYTLMTDGGLQGISLKIGFDFVSKIT
jgi:hypothetical protein